MAVRVSFFFFGYMLSNTVKNLQLHSASFQGTPREAVEFVNIVALTKTDKPLSFISIFGN